MSRVKKQDQIAIVSDKASKTRFVESLADEHDYWMSLTDAARITRTSEAMVRRWVKSGRLPVKQEPVGINQRTRLVRASDIAQIRPIIDPTAAITDQIHKLDLLSIPHQQLLLVEAQGTLLALMQNIQYLIKQLALETRTALEQETANFQQQTQIWNQRLASQHQTVQQALHFQQQQYQELAQQAGNQAQEIQLHAEQLREQANHHQQELENVRILLAGQFEAMNQRLERADQDQRSREEQLRHDYTSLLQQQEIQFRQVLQEIQEALTHHEQERAQIQQHFIALEQSLGTSQQAFHRQLEQHIQHMRIAFEQLRTEETNERMDLQGRTEHLERQMERALTQMEKARSNERERLQALDQHMQTLGARLQEEIDARQTLFAKFTAQEHQPT
jgi:chromosome segregation ATPase